MKIKALFLDVDGTLVSFNTHQVPPSAIETLQQIHQAGIKIIIATGRSATDLHELADIPYDAVIALNGADCVLRNGTSIFRKTVSHTDFKKIENLSKEYGFAMAVETNRGIFVNKLDASVIEVSALVNHNIPQVENLETVFLNADCCQLCMYCNPTTEQLILPQLPGLTTSRWNPLLADIQVKGVDKAAGLHALCSYYGIDTSETMAIGDGGNDITMLQAAGMGVAMGEAAEDVKKAADYVTDPVDADGLRNALVTLCILEG